MISVSIPCGSREGCDFLRICFFVGCVSLAVRQFPPQTCGAYLCSAHCVMEMGSPLNFIRPQSAQTKEELQNVLECKKMENMGNALISAA